jgi:hypothetical protein
MDDWWSALLRHASEKDVLRLIPMDNITNEFAEGSNPLRYQLIHA